MSKDNEQASQVERCIALEAIIAHAPDMGIEKALIEFGCPLTATEKKLISTLTMEELKALRTIKGKVGPLLRKVNNHMINNK